MKTKQQVEISLKRRFNIKKRRRYLTGQTDRLFNCFNFLFCSKKRGTIHREIPEPYMGNVHFFARANWRTEIYGRYIILKKNQLFELQQTTIETKKKEETKRKRFAIIIVIVISIVICKTMLHRCRQKKESPKYSSKAHYFVAF